MLLGRCFLGRGYVKSFTPLRAGSRVRYNSDLGHSHHIATLVVSYLTRAVIRAILRGVMRNASTESDILPCSEGCTGLHPHHRLNDVVDSTNPRKANNASPLSKELHHVWISRSCRACNKMY